MTNLINATGIRRYMKLQHGRMISQVSIKTLEARMRTILGDMAHMLPPATLNEWDAKYASPTALAVAKKKEVKAL